MKIKFKISQNVLIKKILETKEKFSKNGKLLNAFFLLFLVRETREFTRGQNLEIKTSSKKKFFFGSLDDDWLSYVFFKHHLIIPETLSFHSWKRMQFNLKWSIKLMCWKLIFRWYLSVFNFFFIRIASQSRFSTSAQMKFYQDS